MEERRFVALGYLSVDCYYVRNNRPDNNNKYKPIKIDGGASRYNVLVNLAAKGCKTRAFIITHKDEVSNFVISKMEELGVEMKLYKSNYNETKIYHIYPNLAKEKGRISTQTCPLCGTQSWFNKDEKIPFFKFLSMRSMLGLQDVLILDGIKVNTIPFIKLEGFDKVLDIGRVKRLDLLSNQELLKILKYRIDIIQLNQSVEDYLYKRFNIKEKNPIELFKIMNTPLLIITRGKKGADFVFGSNRVISKELSKPTIEVDETGAGDAFFSVFVKEFYKNQKRVNKTFIDKTFEEATKLTSQVVSHMGARGHLYKGLLL